MSKENDNPYDDLTTYLNTFEIPSLVDTTVVVEEKEKLPKRPKQNKNSKRIKRLKREKDILSQELLTLRVQFDDLKEYLEKESKRQQSIIKSDLREIKTILKELKGTSLSFHHEPSTRNNIIKQHAAEAASSSHM